MPKLGDIKKAKEIGYKGTCKYIWTACLDCRKERWVQFIKDKPRILKCDSCGRKGKNMGSNNPSFGKFGKESPVWKGGRYKDGQGYIRVLADPTNFFFEMKNSDGYILEHRLVMAQFLGRCLKPWEIVHHKNHIKNDNRIENLELMKILTHRIITILEEENKRLKEEIRRLKDSL